MNGIMPNSSSIILILLTVLLIITLIWLFGVMLNYYDHNKLLQKASKRVKDLNKLKNKDFPIFLFVINYSFEKNIENELKNQEHAFSLISDYVKIKYEKEKEFDSSFYETIKQLNEKFCQQKNIARNTQYATSILNCLIPSDFPSAGIIIPKETYACLFAALRTQLDYGKTDWVYEYWQQASQYRYSNTELPKSEMQTIGDTSNKALVKLMRSNEENNQCFEEFHFWIAAMILNKGKYELLDKILSFSVEESQENPLIPSSFRTICEYCTEMNQCFNENKLFYIDYSFTGSFSYNEYIVQQEFMNKYLALMLYRLNSNNIQLNNYMKGWLNFPFKDELGELRNWLKHIKRLKKEVKYWDENKEHEAFKTFIINNDYEARNNPIERLDNLIKDIEYAIKNKQINGKLDRVQEFKDQTLKIFKRTISHLDNFTSKKKIKNSNMECLWNFTPEHRKSEDFMSDGNNSYSHAISNPATSYINYRYKQFAESFLQKKIIKDENRYSFHAEDAFNAIDKLISKNADKFIIINFGSALNQIIDLEPIKIDGLLKIADGKYQYNNIEIREYEYFLVPRGGTNLVVIPIEKLPYIEAIKPTKKELKAYCLGESDKLDKDSNLYANVIEANQNTKLQKHLLATTNLNADNVVLYCMVCIYCSYNIYWAKDTEAAMIKVLNHYYNNEEESNLKDVKPLNLPK